MYVSTYTNIHGENAVFVHHQGQPWPLLIVGDDLTPEPAWVRLRDGCFHIVPLSQAGKPLPDAKLLGKHGKAARDQYRAQLRSGEYANGYILGHGEQDWLRACWEASTYYREQFGKDARESLAEAGGDLAALRGHFRDDLAARLTDDDLRELTAAGDAE
jgi:hypothetical protein